MSEQDRKSLRRRLTRLSARRPVRTDGVSGPPEYSSDTKINFPLYEQQTPLGPTVILEKTYPFTTRHGHTPIGDLLRLSPYLNKTLTGIESSGGLNTGNLVFLDTETTGLAGGAGTLAFLIGVGYVRQEHFLLRQYFLRSPGEEAAMLSVLEEDLGEQPVFVTYNGRVFDLPLLETRALVGLRKRWRLSAFPHIDLLHLTRRMWRKVLPDCRLSTVERILLGVERTGKDIPGAEIPEIYKDYLRSGNTAGIQRVCYHNEIDILSLISLMIQLAERFSQEDLSRLPDGEVLALARWYERAGEEGPAEVALRKALGSLQDEVRLEALQHYSFRMKREGRYEEAVENWCEWAGLAPDDPTPCIELAKYYEWRQRDYCEARQWAQDALVCLTYWPANHKRKALWDQIEHRQKRLAAKAARDSDA